jgi:hypothetical protein
MKQVIYDLEPQQVLGILLETIKPEDGDYEMYLDTESYTAAFPQIYPQQRQGTFVGHMVRVIGFRLVKASIPSPISIGVKDGNVISQPIQGELFDDPDRNQDGSEQSS